MTRFKPNSLSRYFQGRPSFQAMLTQHTIQEQRWPASLKLLAQIARRNFKELPEARLLAYVFGQVSGKTGKVTKPCTKIQLSAGDLRVSTVTLMGKQLVPGLPLKL